MNLTATEHAFVAKRRKLVAAWPWVGGGLIFALLGLAVWLWVRVPLMINPWAAIRDIEAGAVEETTLILMAVMLPITLLACLGALIAMLALFFAAFSNERKLIAVIDRFQESGP